MLVASATTAGSAPAGAGTPDPTRSITVTGEGVTTYPAFDPDVNRYGVRTTAATGGALTITASTSDPNGTITVNGRPAPNGAPVPVTGLADGDEVAIAITDAAGTTSYGFIHLPAGFPAVTATSSGAGPSDGLVFVTLNSFLAVPPFVTALDTQGVPAFAVSARGSDFKRAPDGRYSVARQTDVPGRTGWQILALDEGFQEVDRHETVGLVNTDFHDSVLLPGGGALLMAYEPDEHSGGPVTDSMIQELAPDGSVAFEWDSEDHIPIDDALFGEAIGDYAHLNSLDVMEGGDILASFRNTSQVLRIARTAHDGFQPGDVVWRLGGVSSDFTFVDDPEGGFCAQHTAYEVEPGRILLFDNGAADTGNPQTDDECPDPADPGQRHGRPFSRVVEYELDEDAMTATLVWSHQAEDRYTQFAGSSQRLGNGNTMIGWVGPSPIATEVAADGTEVWSLAIEGYTSYRAFKFDAPDAIEPTLDVVTPAEGQILTRDEIVEADFGCADTGGSTLQTCVGDVASGTPLDTSTPGEHTFTVTATDGEGNTTEVTRTYEVAVGEHQPDGVIRRKARGPWIGNLRYNADGTGQTVVLNGRRGRVVTALVRFQDDGSEPDTFRLLGSRNTGSFQVRYFRGARDISAAVKAGTFTTPAVRPGSFFPLRIEITVKRSAVPGAEQRVRLSATSLAEPARADTVVAVARAFG